MMYNLQPQLSSLPQVLITKKEYESFVQMKKFLILCYVQRQFIIKSKLFQMKVSSASMLMNELVKRYQISIPQAPKATPVKTLKRNSSQANDPLNVQVTNLKLKLNLLEKQNQNLKLTIQQQGKKLAQKQNESTAAQVKLKEKEDQFEQWTRQANLKTKQLQTHNAELQYQLLSIKNLLRQQETIIIELMKHQQSD